MRKPTGDTKRAVGYLRTSTEEQTLGPETQRAALEPWCTANGVELTKVFTDRGVSGGASLDKRPALLAATSALKQHGASAPRKPMAQETAMKMLHNG